MFCQARPDRPMKCWWSHRLECRYSRWLRGKDCCNKAGFGFCCECCTASPHLVEQSTEGENVRSRICFFALQLFGSHVLEGSENGSFCSQPVRERCLACTPATINPALRHFDH